MLRNNLTPVWGLTRICETEFDIYDLGLIPSTVRNKGIGYDERLE